VVNVLGNLLRFDFPSGTYNLSEHNVSIESIAGLIKEIFPGLDMIFVNQHLVMREIKVEPDLRIKKLLTMEPISMKQELIRLKDKFSFSSFGNED
jgi:UDP-glucose 4-epimerase